MGGRGAAAGTFLDIAAILGASMQQASDNFANDKPTKKQTRLVKKLLKKNIVVMESTDNIPDIIQNNNLSTINMLAKKYPGAIKELTKQDAFYVRADKMDPFSQAYSAMNPLTFEAKRIVYNDQLKKTNLKAIALQADKQMSTGFWQKVDKKNYTKYITTHEFGHFIQDMIIINQIKKDPTSFEAMKTNFNNKLYNKQKRQVITSWYDSRASEIKKQILKIHDKNFGTLKPTDLSQYGQKNDFEFFAEVFAGANLNSQPNNLQKSMLIYLKEELKQ